MQFLLRYRHVLIVLLNRFHFISNAASAASEARMAHWEHVDTFVNLVSQRGSTEYASARNIFDWLLEEVRNQFDSNEGWSPYKRQDLKSAVTFLKQCENDLSKKDRASTLKGKLFERIQNASEQNDKVTLSDFITL